MTNILFDIRMAQSYLKHGVFRYCWDLVLHLTKNKLPEQNVFLLIDKRVSPMAFQKCQEAHLNIVDLGEFDKKTENLVFDDWIIGTFIYFWTPQKWETVTYIYPENIIKKCRRIIGIIFDMIPLYHQEECLQTWGQKINFALQFEALKLADHYLCISQYTMKVAQQLLNRPKNDFTCIYGSTDLNRWHNKNSEIPYCAMTRKNHITYVAGDIPRKNVDNLIYAFCKAMHSGKIPQDTKLWILSAHKSSEMIAYLEKEHLNEQVCFPGFITDQEMLDLIASARCNFFPSLYEGLGLPILESYAAGTPCFAANTTSTKELVRPEDCFDPTKPEEISEFIIKAFNDEKICQANLEFGRKLLKKLTWDNVAKHVIQILTTEGKERPHIVGEAQ